MEKVLVTGGIGFIGSHVTDLLCEKGYEVTIIDNLSTSDKRNLNRKAKLIETDINSDILDNVFKDGNFSYVFHFAAQANVKFSTEHPEIDARENILGSIKILKLAKEHKVKKVILASSAAVYGKPKYLPVDEDHSVDSLSCYGLSKLTMEQYARLMDVNHIILRFANVYGPRQSTKGEAGVVAIFADRMKNNQEITIDDDGEQTRDFIYVKDVTNACLRAMQSDIINATINISTSKAISINELFERMAKIYNYKKAPIYGKKRFGDIRHSILDNSRAKQKLGFEPKFDLNTGLERLLKD